MHVSAKTQRRKDAKETRTILFHFAPLRLCAFALIASAVVIAFCSTIAADDPPAKTKSGQPKSLNQQLLDELDADLLKDLPGKPVAPARPKTGGQSPSDANEPAPASGATDPLAILGERMRDVQRRIARRDTSDETQTLQRQIQDDLAALIEQARQQAAAAGKPGSGQGQLAGSSGGNPTPAPPRDTTNRLEQGTKVPVETADVQDLIRRFWGHLPDKLREQMQSSLSEQFLPKYERLIEDYYRRLAEDPSTTR